MPLTYKPFEGLSQQIDDKIKKGKSEKVSSESGIGYREESLRHILNKLKLKEKYKDNAEEFERALKQERFTDQKEILEDSKLKRSLEFLLQNLDLIESPPDEEHKNQIAEHLDQVREITGLDFDKVKELLQIQKEMIKEEALILRQKEKKKEDRGESTEESFWQKLKRWSKKPLSRAALRVGVYAGLGFGAAVLGIPGLIAGGGMAVARLSEAFLRAKKDKKLKDTEKEIFQFLKDSKSELFQESLKNLALFLSQAKQEQIDGLDNFKEDLKKLKKEKEREKLVEERRKSIQEGALEYLKAQGFSLEQAQDMAQKVAALAEIDGHNEILLLGEEERLLRKLADNRFLKEIGKFLRGGETAKDKLTTSVVFTIASFVARFTPGLRNILLAYVGYRAGEAGGRWLAQKLWKKEKVITSQDLLKEDLTSSERETLLLKAQCQLLDPDFKKNVSYKEYLELQKTVDSLKEKQIKEINSAEEALEDVVKSTRENITSIFKKRRWDQRKRYFVEKSMGIAGAVAGGLLAEVFTPKEKKIFAKEELKTDTYQVASLEETVSSTSETNPYLIEVQKGDNLWKIIERKLTEEYGDKFEHLNEAQKTYIIDAFKDRVVENPAEYGLKDPGLLLPGQKIDLSSLLEDKEALNNALKEATSLSPEQTQSILEHNEAIKEWLATHPNEHLTQETVDHIIQLEEISKNVDPHQILDRIYQEKLEEFQTQELLTPLKTHLEELEEEIETPSPVGFESASADTTQATPENIPSAAPSVEKISVSPTEESGPLEEESVSDTTAKVSLSEEMEKVKESGFEEKAIDYKLANLNTSLKDLSYRTIKEAKFEQGFLKILPYEGEPFKLPLDIPEDVKLSLDKQGFLHIKTLQGIETKGRIIIEKGQAFIKFLESDQKQKLDLFLARLVEGLE